MQKSDLRTLIRELIDDPDAVRWSNANLDSLTNLTYKRIWAQILRVNPNFLQAIETVAAANLDAPGSLNMEESGSGGQLSNSIFRLIKVRREEVVYNEVSEFEVQFDATSGEVQRAPDYTWLAREKTLWLFPIQDDDDVTLQYSYYPTAYTSLGESTDVPWVENHEDALIWSVAAQAMLKGAAEDNQLLYYQARDAIEAMLGSVQTISSGPTVMTHHGDGTYAWGSET